MQRSAGLSIGVGLLSLGMYAVRQRRGVYQAALAQAKRTPPVLAKKPHMVPFGNVPGEVRGDAPMDPILYIEDPYYYVRDDTRKNKEVIAHLEKENEYAEHMTSHLKNARENIYRELLSHVQETDVAYPYPHGDYLYYTRTEKGSSYTYHCRKSRHDANAKEELILDENELAKGQSHCDVGAVSISPDHKFLAYSVDFNGYETYQGFVKNLVTGEILSDRIENVSGGLVWGTDASTVYYSTMDDAHRQDKIWRHTVGSSVKDELIYTEDDQLFSAYMGKTRSGRYLLLQSSSSETSEVSFIDLQAPAKGVTLVEKRVKGVTYSVDHQGDAFFIETNKDGATNFKLMTTPVATPSAAHWTDVFPYDAAVKVDGIDCFESFSVLHGRQDGFTQLWIVTKDAAGAFTKERMAFSDPIYTISGAPNKEYATQTYRLTYSSPTTPFTTYDYDVGSRQMTLLKERPVPNYDRSLYACERIEATAEDGTRVPMSLVYRKDKRTPGTPQPLHLYGYGSYEICIDPTFSATTLPLLDRGVIYVIAHIRGGGEMGRTWYEDAKYLTKAKTFSDFVSCAEHLVATKMTQPSLLTCEGRSAGGLLMGAVLNMRPDLFQAAIAGVPFVDVMNSMCDATIPLTTGEWEEWGNPNEAKYFSYMLSYSPYENVKAQKYPNILVTSGLFDPRVAYWEPTKWVARLRERKTDDNAILLKMDLTSGHFSASDRYHYLREKAFDLSYLLDQVKCLTPDDHKAPAKKD
ncbi:serine protease family S09A [Achlya hypogyna]|uniref:Prolyl endopeptidase n=1 Tax=Achlya hypogyna TaxID=1202772 RepID=A0A1V9ZL47_ACHHY|nr:serine protease family S09A [Achlya hypogyna]